MQSLSWVMLFTFLVACGQGADPQSQSALQSAEASAVELHDPGVTGPYQVLSYVPTTQNSGYQSAIIYYPADSSAETLPTTTLSGGFSDSKEAMSWLGMHLASHGFVTIVFTPTHTLSLDARVWAKGHKASLATVQAESLNSDSPIAHRVDSNRLGVMGFSYGGAGAILAANQLGKTVKSVVPICAFYPAQLSNPIPTMFITGTDDSLASPWYIQMVFKALRSPMPSAFVKINKMIHSDVTHGTHLHDSVARFATAWSQVFLAKVPAYSTYINGDEAQKQINNPQVIAKARDYIYRDRS